MKIPIQIIPKNIPIGEEYEINFTIKMSQFLYEKH